MSVTTLSLPLTTLTIQESKDGESQIDESPINTKSLTDFRNYEDSLRQSRVESFYLSQHTHQTFEFVEMMEKKYFNFNLFELGLWECLEFLDTFVDDSDPDTELSQLQHALQAAEAARIKYPNLDWLHLTALIHDCGKILSIACHEPQWAVVGDTFPVGCKFSDKNVFPEYFQYNQDFHHPIYSKPLGIYSPHCGLDKLKLSFGHDEYLYRVCINNQCLLPEQSLAMIRYHSFYPWHSHGAYREFTNPHDEEMRKWVLLFNEFDLYSKDLPPVDVEAVKPYYKTLIKKYFPLEKLKW